MRTGTVPPQRSRRQAGAMAIEYALIVAFVTLLLTASTGLGVHLDILVGNISAALGHTPATDPNSVP